MNLLRQPSIDERIPAKEKDTSLEKKSVAEKSQAAISNLNSGGGTGEANVKNEEITIDDEDCTVNVSSEGEDIVNELEAI